jgi:hypothetical protein
MAPLASSDLPLRFALAGATQEPTVTFGYRLAGLDIESDVPLPALGEPRIRPGWRRSAAPPGDWPSAPTFSGRVWLAGSWLELASWWNPAGQCRLQVDHGTTWVIDRNTGLAEVIERGHGHSLQQLQEVALGPPLLLLLASHGLFALHASAAEVEGRLCAFLGPSGEGKSTLSAAAFPGWRRLADDLLPVTLFDGQPEARPDFPQLKLGVSERLHEPPLPLAACFLLASREEMQAEPECKRLPRLEAAAALLRHTMAARIFDQPLLGLHLDFVKEVVRTIPTFQLAYPRNLDELPRLRQMVMATSTALDDTSPTGLAVAGAARPWHPFGLRSLGGL